MAFTPSARRPPTNLLSPPSHIRAASTGGARNARGRAVTLTKVTVATTALLAAWFVLSATRRWRATLAASSVPHDLMLRDTAKTIFFVVTASLTTATASSSASAGERQEEEAKKREFQYRRGIRRLVEEVTNAANAATAPSLPLPYKVIIVENNGRRSTFLDALYPDDDVVKVMYTDSNASDDEKGAKELNDLLSAATEFGMGDADLVVKMTGRYYFDDGGGGGGWMALAKDGEEAGRMDSDASRTATAATTSRQTTTTVPFMAALRDLDPARTRALIKFGSYVRPVDYPVLDCVTGLIMLPVAAIRRIDRTVLPIERSWARAALSLPPEEVLPVVGKMGIYIAPGGRKKYYLI